MARLESDLTQVLLAACKGELRGVTLEWAPGFAMVVVMASKGYPVASVNRTVIRNLEAAEAVAPSVKILHAGTTFDSDGNFPCSWGHCQGEELGRSTSKSLPSSRSHQLARRVLPTRHWVESTSKGAIHRTKWLSFRCNLTGHSNVTSLVLDVFKAN